MGSTSHTIPELLDVLALKGCIVSIDAMGCQKEIAKKIVSKKEDYVLALKGNQGNLHADVKSFFYDAAINNFSDIEHAFFEEFDKGHGRIEHRQCWVINPEKQLACFSDLGSQGITAIKLRKVIQIAIDNI